MDAAPRGLITLSLTNTAETPRQAPQWTERSVPVLHKTLAPTKHAVQAISEAMRIDLLSHKIKVTVIHPGAAETEFSLVRLKQDVNEAKKVYEGYEPLHAKDIADIVYYSASLPAHVCINEMEVTCLAQANSFYLFNEPV